MVKGRYALYETTKDFGDYLTKQYSCVNVSGTREKTKKPITIDGVQKQLDLETGEIKNYTKENYEESLSRSKSRSKINIRDLLFANVWEWFFTLTFDKQVIDRHNQNLVQEAYEKYIDNLKKQCPNMYYVSVPELHKDGATHFHMVVGGVTAEELKLADSGKVTCSLAFRKACSQAIYNAKYRDNKGLKESDGMPIYNVTAFKYGFTSATHIVNLDKTRSYLLKYLTKHLNARNQHKKRYYTSRNIKRPMRTTKVLFTAERKIDVKTFVDLNNINDLLVLDVYYNKERNVYVRRIVKTAINITKLSKKPKLPKDIFSLEYLMAVRELEWKKSSLVGLHTIGTANFIDRSNPLTDDDIKNLGVVFDD